MTLYDLLDHIIGRRIHSIDGAGRWSDDWSTLHPSETEHGIVITLDDGTVIDTCGEQLQVRLGQPERKQ